MVITAAAHSEWRHHTNFIRLFQHCHDATNTTGFNLKAKLARPTKSIHSYRCSVL
jgi:hypothetical protein